MIIRHFPPARIETAIYFAGIAAHIASPRRNRFTIPVHGLKKDSQFLWISQ